MRDHVAGQRRVRAGAGAGAAQRPRAAEREPVRPEPVAGRGRVAPGARVRRRRVALGAREPEIRLWCGPRGRHDVLRRARLAGGPRARLAEQRPDRRLGPVVVALAELHVAHMAGGVDQVLGRPVLVLVGVPRGHPVVLGDRIADALAADRRGHVAGVALEGELRRVHADDRQPVRPVRAVPGLQVRQRAQAVDAGVGPEVDEHDPAAQGAERQRAGVEPALVADEVGRRAVVLQGGRRVGGGVRSATGRAGRRAAWRPHRTARAHASDSTTAAGR